MFKKVVKPLEGFEKLFNEISGMKAKHEAEKEEAIRVAVAEVEAKFAQKSANLDELFDKVTVTEEVEIPDEEVAEEVVAEEAEVLPEDGTISF